jgi:Na+/proline symporter
MHALDFAVVGAYLAIVLALGRWAAKGARSQEAFFLAERKFGKLRQFIFNFGNTTDANTAVSTVSFVYREGVSGAWFPLQMLFLNPYYWFMGVWFRRVRLMTTAELFEERLESPGLAWCYALFQIGAAVLTIGFSNFVVFKIMVAVMPQLPPLAFYLGYASVIALYLALGGLVATVLNQMFQGVLVLIFSVMLLPVGWRALGSGAALRERLDPSRFDLVGAPGGDQLTWYAVAALLLVSLIQINGNLVNMGLGGSARSEFAARFGAVAGTFGKRILIVVWAIVGLIAAALCRGPSRLTDPDLAWGVLSRQLLGPGFLGLMLAGVLAANMASTASKTMAVSALCVRTLCRPFAARLGETGAVAVGRWAVGTALAGSVGAALGMDKVLTVMKLVLTINLPFGAAVLLMFFWRRLTRTAVWWCVILTTVLIFILPFSVQAVPALARGAPQFFDSVTHQIPGDLTSPLLGSGRFNLEAWTLSRCGVALFGAGPSELLSIQFFLDAAFPFVLLIGISLLTLPPSQSTVSRFFGIMKTPIGPTPDLEAEAVAATRLNPARFDQQKLFPGSDWEFTRWDRTDALGFALCAAIAGAILGLFWLILQWLR